MHKKTLKNISLKFDNYIGNVFYGIFIFALLFYNNKLILIYFSSTLSIKEKIDMLSQSNILYWQPFFYALIITMIYLTLNFVFYFLTLEYNKRKIILGNKYLSKKEKIKNLKEEKKLNQLEQYPELAKPNIERKPKIKNQGYKN